MIYNFKNQATQDIFNGKVTKQALKICPRSIWKMASRKLDQLDSASLLEELRVPPGHQFEALHRDRKGQHSIRLNDQYRIYFRWSEKGPSDVEITDYH